MRRLLVSELEPAGQGVHRVISAEELSAGWRPDLQCLLLCQGPEDWQLFRRLRRNGLSIGAVSGKGIENGDVVAVRSDKPELMVLFRESDLHHALLLTNRCNSYCLMCSQPPTPQLDPWLMEEALAVVHHIRCSPVSLGLSGGEPLLLGASELRRLIALVAERHPSTRIDLLSNGRLLGQPSLAHTLLHRLEARLSWLVPLYGHADFLHDYVVQSPGAFDETLAGLLELQRHGQSIQLRIVLIAPVLESLPEICRFIARNLPFVSEVALMAAEPIGLALANRQLCEVDLAKWGDVLVESCQALRRGRVPFVFMNAPLCALPMDLWPAASRSISDWKQVYASECELCEVKARCCGLFAWHERGWQPTKIKPIRRVEA
ncbi:His-Xaa-Ser system radical SAM maturase HxsC [Roseateles sp. DAIF2]|uniref:His-Xaa-Ser system radical SAM maturase HxsC n=1 Tax=Roseateles sp. DAIF2 TaxID=2714952 RepID=UPI0018A2D137|nr:His-Xaa-Ser system radical SAM maturase HxsC [Roseateles sp. DAIF2]QPF75868.1 His-Xaa-Ser system radical SAM maturase HxsC [Roseateles sp. DAIF2]